MVIQVTTLSGSVYRIDYAKRTWERTSSTILSGKVRTDGGTWTELLLIGEGFPMSIIGPPLDPAMDVRSIETTTVTKIEEID